LESDAVEEEEEEEEKEEKVEELQCRKIYSDNKETSLIVHIIPHKCAYRLQTYVVHVLPHGITVLHISA
jgi:hypothetical protein